MAGISLKKLYKIFPGNVIAVHDFNLEIEDGEFIVLVGPSGCGKSTTLRMIAGLEEITEGEIFIGDTLVNNVAPKDRNIAMVFQNYALYPHMTVYKNMAFGLKLRREKNDVIKEKVTEAARILDIENLLKRKPKQLSGGQRQRVALGRAMVRNPAVFLLDEPLSNLDAKLRTSMRAELSKLHKKLATTFVYVTHDQVEAMTMGDRIVVMKDGYIQQVDTPQNLYDNPINQFVAGFIGAPQMNFIEVTVKKIDSGYGFDLGGKEFPILEDRADKQRVAEHVGKKIIVGIRPEHIYLQNDHLERTNCVVLEFNVDLAEPMGSEIYLYGSIPETNIISKIPPNIFPKAGDKIELRMDCERLHYFDVETGEAI
jgi:multiple sugar transport system ATP-binding protein